MANAFEKFTSAWSQASRDTNTLPKLLSGWAVRGVRAQALQPTRVHLFEQLLRGVTQADPILHSRRVVEQRVNLPDIPAGERDAGSHNDAVDKVHHHMDALVLLRNLVGVRDVGMHHLGHPLRLPDQPGPADALPSRMHVEELNRDLPVEPLIVACVHHAHATRSQFSQDRESAQVGGKRLLGRNRGPLKARLWECQQSSPSLSGCATG